MIDFFKKLFSSAPKVNMKDIIAKGAIIVDVRTPGEYSGGHIKGSVNIPLDRLKAGAAKLNKNNPVITCCASGMRSASAKSVLLGMGFTEVYNGGGWRSLANELE
jgi:phage shock protein E